MCASTYEGRPSDDEGTFPRTTGQHGFTCRNGHHRSEDVVGIVLQQPIGVFDVRLDINLLVWSLNKMKIFHTKAVLLDKAPAALLIAYGGFR